MTPSKGVIARSHEFKSPRISLDRKHDADDINASKAMHNSSRSLSPWVGSNHDVGMEHTHSVRVIWLASHPDGSWKEHRKTVCVPPEPWLLTLFDEHHLPGFATRILHSQRLHRSSLPEMASDVSILFRKQWQIIAVLLVGPCFGQCLLPTAITPWCRESTLAWEYYDRPLDAYRVEVLKMFILAEPYRIHHKVGRDTSASNLSAAYPLFLPYLEADMASLQGQVAYGAARRLKEEDS